MAICFCAVTFIGLGPKFLDSGSQLSLNGSPQNFTEVWCGLKPENLPAKIFYLTPKKFGGENLKLRRPSADPPSVGSV